MSLVCSKPLRRSMRAALAARHPDVSRRAALRRFRESVGHWRYSAIQAAIVIGLAPIWLGGGYFHREVPVVASAGIAGIYWLLFAFVLGRALHTAAAKEFSAPEILRRSPVDGRILSLLARRVVRRKMGLWILTTVFFAVESLCLFAFRGRLPWNRLPLTALVFIAEILLFAAALPVILNPLKVVMQRAFSDRPGFVLDIVAVPLVPLGLVALGAPMLLTTYPVQQAGMFLADLLPTSRLLMAAAGLHSPDVIDWAVPAVLIAIALPGFKRRGQAWHELRPVDTDMQPFWTPEQYNDEDEDEPLTPVEPPAEIAAASGIPDKSDLAAGLRDRITSAAMSADWTMVPDIPPLTWRSVLPSRRWLVAGLTGMAAGACSGRPELQIIGWIWLLSPVVVFATLPPLTALWTVEHATLGKVCLHEALPVSVRPIWKAVERHQHRGALSAIGTAVILVPAGIAVASLAAQFPQPWPWRKAMDVSPTVCGLYAFTTCTALALILRTVAPVRFGTALLPKSRLTLLPRLARVLPVVFTAVSVLCIAFTALAVALIVRGTDFVSDDIIALAGCAAGAELLRHLAAATMLRIWATGRRK